MSASPPSPPLLKDPARTHDGRSATEILRNSKQTFADRQPGKEKTKQKMQMHLAQRVTASSNHAWYSILPTADSHRPAALFFLFSLSFFELIALQTEKLQLRLQLNCLAEEESGPFASVWAVVVIVGLRQPPQYTWFERLSPKGVSAMPVTPLRIRVFEMRSGVPWRVWGSIFEFDEAGHYIIASMFL